MRKNLIIVAHINERRVATIMESPDERSLTANEIQQLDSVLLKRVMALAEIYSPTEYDIMSTRAFDLTDLKAQYPEFSGWHLITVMSI